MPLGSGRYQEPNVPEVEVGSGLMFFMWEAFGPLPLEGGAINSPLPVGPRVVEAREWCESLGGYQ